VRELRNEVARAVSLGMDLGHRGPPQVTSPSIGATVDLSELLFAGRERIAEAYERAYIEAALRQTSGNVSRAAELAGVNRKFIQRAMKRFGVRGDGEPESRR
jgi:DNA-binding NtrC family response regulator